MRRLPKLLSRPINQELLVDTAADGELELEPAMFESKLLVSVPFKLALRSAWAKQFDVLELTPYPLSQSSPSTSISQRSSKGLSLHMFLKLRFSASNLNGV